MRICLVYPGFPPYEAMGGGISTYVSVFAHQLARQGVDVTVISRIEGSEAKSEIMPSGVQLYLLPTDDAALAEVDDAYTFCKLGGGLYSRRVRDFIEVLEARSPAFDVIEFGDWGAEGFHAVQAWPGRVIVRCLTPSFISESWNPDNPPYLGRAAKIMEKLTLRGARHIVSDSPALMEAIGKELNVTPVWHKIPLPLSIEGIKVKSVYSKAAFSDSNRMKILAAGRVELRKGFDLLIAAQELLERRQIYTSLSFAGSSTPLVTSGNSIEHYEKMKRPHVEFLGHVSRDKLLEKYSAYDVFCMPSRFESFGYVGAEAMAAGLPMIVSDSCGISSYCDADMAYLFESENIEALAKKIEDAYLDYSRAIAVAQHGKAMVRSRFEPFLITDLNLNYFHKIISQ